MDKIVSLDFDSALYYANRLSDKNEVFLFNNLITIWRNSGTSLKSDSILVAKFDIESIDPLELIVLGTFNLFNGQRGMALKAFLKSADLQEKDSDLAIINYIQILHIYSRTLLLGDDFDRYLDKLKITSRDSKIGMAWYYIYRMNYNGKLPESDSLDYIHQNLYNEAEEFFGEHPLNEQVLAYFEYQRGSYWMWYGKYDTAKVSFNQAIKNSESYGYLQLVVFNSYIQLAGIESRLGNYGLARDFLALAKENKTKYDVHLTELNYELAVATNYYENTKQWDSAYFSLKNALGPTIQVFAEEHNIQLNDLVQKYEVEKKENEIEAQKNRISDQNRIIWIVVLFVFSLFVFSIVLVYAFRNIRKKNKKIETLMRELHHRVKNNLQVISSLLGLQSIKLKDKVAKKAVSEGKDRIRAMSLIHQRLYQNEEVTSLNIKEYITNLVNELAQSYGYYNKAVITIEAPSDSFDVDTSLPIGLIINEIVSNAFKYAFKNVAEPSLDIHLVQKEKKSFNLHIGDNGVGLPADFEIDKSTSFGMKLVDLLVKQLQGKLKVENKDGLHYYIDFQVSGD